MLFRSVATTANLACMFLLTNLQAGASYPRRIILALIIDIVVFTILALSTVFFVNVSPGVYFAFLLTTVLATSTATGLLQNGALAFVATFAHPSYMQAIMTGQAVAGVLPSIAQIVSVLAVPEESPSSTDAAPPAVPPPPNLFNISIHVLPHRDLCRRPHPSRLLSPGTSSHPPPAQLAEIGRAHV